MLNPQSPIPLYYQLADILSEKIRAGEYPTGSRIPSENRLAEAYGIGRPTVRQAVDLLIRRRMLLRRRGSGTYVQPQAEEVDLFSLAGTTSAFHKKGISVVTRILEPMGMITAGEDPENPFAGGNAYFFSRLSIAEDIPVLIEDLYFHPDLFRGIDAVDLKGRSVSQIVDELFHMRPVGGRQNFRIGYVNGKRAGHLAAAKTAPLLIVRRFLHFPQADNAIYSELYCRTDRFVFSQDIGGKTYE